VNERDIKRACHLGDLLMGVAFNNSDERSHARFLKMSASLGGSAVVEFECRQVPAGGAQCEAKPETRVSSGSTDLKHFLGAHGLRKHSQSLSVLLRNT